VKFWRIKDLIRSAPTPGDRPRRPRGAPRPRLTETQWRLLRLAAATRPTAAEAAAALSLRITTVRCLRSALVGMGYLEPRPKTADWDEAVPMACTAAGLKAAGKARKAKAGPTPAQLRLLRLGVASGPTVAQAAAHLGLSEKTVRMHLAALRGLGLVAPRPAGLPTREPTRVRPTEAGLAAANEAKGDS